MFTLPALLALKASRPGWWIVTIWLYVLPTAVCGGNARAQFAILAASWRFWLGLVYVTFPLNLLVYVWNDVADQTFDRGNARKDSFLYGAKANSTQLLWLFRLSFTVQAPFAAALLAADYHAGGGLRMLGWVASVALVNALYNHPLPRLSARPPLDLLAPAGYLLVAVLSAWLNRVPVPGARFWVYNLSLVLRTQIWGQLVDVRVDGRAGRATTAVVLGPTRTRAALVAVLVAELAFVSHAFPGHRVLRAFSAIGAVSLPVASLPHVVQRHQRALIAMGCGLNTAGLGLLAHLWRTGVFCEDWMIK